MREISQLQAQVLLKQRNELCQHQNQKAFCYTNYKFEHQFELLWADGKMVIVQTQELWISPGGMNKVYLILS